MQCHRKFIFTAGLSTSSAGEAANASTKQWLPEGANGDLLSVLRATLLRETSIEQAEETEIAKFQFYLAHTVGNVSGTVLSGSLP